MLDFMTKEITDLLLLIPVASPYHTPAEQMLMRWRYVWYKRGRMADPDDGRVLLACCQVALVFQNAADDLAIKLKNLEDHKGAYGH